MLRRNVSIWATFPWKLKNRVSRNNEYSFAEPYSVSYLVRKMTIQDLYEQITERFFAIPGMEELLSQPVSVRADSDPEPALMPWNYIPFKDRRPEYRVCASFNGFEGEAYTETPSDFDGTLKGAVELPPSDKGIDARCLAAINAAMNSLGLCAGTFPATFDERRLYTDALFGQVCGERAIRSNIILVGYDGYIVKKFVSEDIDFWTMDRDPDNISQDRFKHVIVNSGFYNREACFAWGKLFIITGSTLTNGTIVQYLDRGKELLFYGITIAGAATLLGLPWFPVKRKPDY